MSKDTIAPAAPPVPPNRPESSCQSIEWYAEGQERVVEVGDVRFAVRFVGRHGRRGRIAITAPSGTVFYAPERGT
jgi:hypothetical protein